MSSPLNLDLDFLEYTPTTGRDATQSSTTDTAPRREQPGVQIKIPEAAIQQASGNQGRVPASNSSNLFQNLMSNAASLGSQSSLSDEAVRQLVWAASRQRQNQQRANKSSGNFNWALNYLSQYFDVSTTDVLERIIWSAIPIRKTGLDIDHLDDADELMVPLQDESKFSPTSEKIGQHLADKQRPYSHMERFIESRPDFYGPFWVSATLVFVIAIFSNIASFASYHSKLSEFLLPESGPTNSSLNKSADNVDAELNAWNYSMDELNMSSSLVMVYVTVIPTLLWFCFWVRGCSRYYTLTETVCAYGYSLSIFIPLTIMLTIQSVLFRYLLITLAAALSGTVLMLSFLPVVKSDPNPASSHIILLFVPLCHFGLAYIIHRIMLQ